MHLGSGARGRCCFERSLVDLGRLGLSGTGLIVAAEHMAASRLRAYKSTPGDSQ
jgi:hypothetical protein